jgi:hypothetical protein
MGLFLEGKWPRLILAAYLACAVMGIFTLGAVEPLRSADFWEDGPSSGVSVTQQDLGPESPIEGELAISKARGHLFSSLRNSSPRTVMPSGTQDAGSVLVQSSLRAIEKTNHPTIKNVILLKLRI